MREVDYAVRLVFVEFIDAMGWDTEPDSHGERSCSPPS